MTGKSRAEEILSSIISSACKQSKVDEGPFPIVVGGEERSGKALVDRYFNPRPTDFRAEIDINTRRAKEVGLVRTRFGITQTIYEWDAIKDWKRGYRTIFEKDVEGPTAVLEMIERMRAIISAPR